MTTAPTPAELNDILLSFTLPSPAPQLTLLLRPARLALRDDAALKSTYGSHSDFWSSFAQVWRIHTDALEQSQAVEVLPSLTTLASLTASLVAGNEANQASTLQYIEPQMRRALLFASSFHNLADENFIPFIRSACQALSNMITANEAVSQSFWSKGIENDETQLLSRILASSDPIILQAVFILLVNITSESTDRARALSATTNGSAILDCVLSQASLQFDADKHNAESQASEHRVDTFELAFSLVRNLIQLDVLPDAYTAQSTISSFAIVDAQLTLLKFLDGFLQPPTLTVCPPETLGFLLDLLPALTTSLEKEHDSTPMDGRDAATFQGAALLVQILSSIGLNLSPSNSSSRKRLIVAVDLNVRLLRWVDGLSKQLEKDTTAVEGWVEPEAVAFLKRSCVRLLGIVGYEDQEPQDEVRERGGLTLLLGMCQISDVNPTLREHALFAIRNILKDNDTNQALINGMQPQYLMGPTGELKDLPPALRPEGERRSH